MSGIRVRDSQADDYVGEYELFIPWEQSASGPEAISSCLGLRAGSSGEDSDGLSSSYYSTPTGPLWSLAIRCPGQIFWTRSTLRSRSTRALIQPMLVFLEQLGISTPRQCGYAMTPVRARPMILSLANVVLEALPIARVQGVAANLSNGIGLSGGRPCIRPAHYVAHHIAVSRESASGAFEVPFSALFATQCGAPSAWGLFLGGLFGTWRALSDLIIIRFFLSDHQPGPPSS